MIAAFGQLNHFEAAWTLFPSFFLGQLLECLIVCVAAARTPMPRQLAPGTSALEALLVDSFAVVDALRLDEIGARRARAVCLVFDLALNEMGVVASEE